ncbi:MAG TPA: ABC transporter substrate-binding protein [Chloroflexota bacterium]|jgi:NitT/TauT family transport system substrate-binding protein|nr:ABC transporter substrate-binding protein [Chloroflexota bacterium]
MLGVIRAAAAAMVLCSAGLTSACTAGTRAALGEGGGAAQPRASPAAAAEPSAVPTAARLRLEPPLAPPVTVKVSTVHSVPDGPVLIGLQQGYFQNEGLQVELIPFGNTGQALAGLATNQLDVVIGGVSANLYNQIARGIGVRVVADGGSTAPGYDWQGIAVRRDLLDSGRVRTPADFRGLKLNRVSIGGVSSYYVTLVLRQHGLAPEDVELVDMPYPDALAAFTTHGIDASALIEPFLTRSETMGATVLLRSLDISPDIPGAAVMMAEGLLGQREAAVRFLRAWLRGVRDYLRAMSEPAQREELLRLFQANQIDIDPRAQVPTFDPNGTLPLRPFAAHLQYLVSAGIVGRPLGIQEVVEPSLIEEAARRLGPYQP